MGISRRGTIRITAETYPRAEWSPDLSHPPSAGRRMRERGMRTAAKTGSHDLPSIELCNAAHIHGFKVRNHHRSMKAVVTGASGGLGMRFARLLAADGYDLVLVARGSDRMSALADELSRKHGVSVSVITADLSAEGMRTVADSISEDVPDILINNAGFGDYGPFLECDVGKQERMIELNVRALTVLTHAVLPGMASRGSGRIMNVASVASFQPGPLMSVYYATKAYVLSFTEALSVELRGTGVTTTALCPGPTNTGFATAAGAEGANLFKEAAGSDPDRIAAYGYRAMMKGKTVAVAGALFKVAVVAERVLPRSVTRRLIYRIQRKSASRN